MSDRIDLMVLVADLDMEQAVRGLFSRPQPLRNAQFSYDVARHPNRDPGCRTQAADYLRPFFRSHRYAMVVFDLDGSGSTASREETQQEVERQLSMNGWGKRSKAIVIDPELEAWVWIKSPIVARFMGWEGYGDLRSWLGSQGLWPTDRPKPPDPKSAMQRAMRQAAVRRRVRRSSSKFFRLGQQVDARGCTDPAFGELRGTLQTWFPEVNDGEG